MKTIVSRASLKQLLAIFRKSGINNPLLFFCHHLARPFSLGFNNITHIYNIQYAEC